MPVLIDEVEVGKSYLFLNNTIRRVIEIVPDPQRKKSQEYSDYDIVRYETEKWTYDAAQYAGKTRIKQKIREKIRRAEFAKDVMRRLD